MHEPDAILLLGLIVAREMGWDTPVAVKLDREMFASFANTLLDVRSDGLLTTERPMEPSVP
jgi:hypothetical protein